MDHESHALTYMKLIDLNFQFIFALVLMNFRESPKTDEELSNDDLQSMSARDKLPKLNSYFHSLHEKLSLTTGEYDLYKIDSILEDYLGLTVKYLRIIETDSWSSDQLANSFTWLSDTFLRKLIQLSAQVDARDKLCSCFVHVFTSFTLLFAIDYELIKSKVIQILLYYIKQINMLTSIILYVDHSNIRKTPKHSDNK